MAIRFRFRNAREVHSVPVTGSGISLKDLKAAIITQRGLGDDRRPVDLLVFDARSRIRENAGQRHRLLFLDPGLAAAMWPRGFVPMLWRDGGAFSASLLDSAELVDEEAQVLRNSVLEVTLASAVASAAPLGNAANTTAIQQAAG